MSGAFDVDLHLLPESDGGRTTPMESGYRSLMRFGTAEAEPPWGVQVEFDGGELPPGAEARVRVTTWADAPPVSSGTPVWLFEGARLVATGTVR